MTGQVWILRKRAFKRLVIAVLITGAVGGVAAYALIGLIAWRLLCN